MNLARIDHGGKWRHVRPQQYVHRVRIRTFVGQSGQAMSEYAVILGAIAVGCIVAVLFLGGGIFDKFGGAAKPLAGQPHKPPVAGELPYPTTLEECEDGGWLDFPQFPDEEACREYVESLTP
jgi:Flp pilus assembly pilin Flp